MRCPECQLEMAVLVEEVFGRDWCCPYCGEEFEERF